MWYSDSSVSCKEQTVCLWGQMSKGTLIFLWCSYLSHRGVEI